MSLLIAGMAQKRAEKIALRVFEDAFQRMPTPYSKSDPDKADAPFEGLVQTILLLELSVNLNEPEFFRWCSAWAYVMMAKRMPLMGKDVVRLYTLTFCDRLKDHLDWLPDSDKRNLASEMLDDAMAEITQTDCDAFKIDYLDNQPYEAQQRRFLQLLLDKDIKGATQLILSVLEEMPIAELYTSIIQNVMYEVGELWHQNLISVAQEHYCTAAVQTILALCYPRLMSAEPNGRKAVVACVGNELHELGARMVSDLLENDGWNSIFLGAAVPLEDLKKTLREERPELCALSVSMQQGIPECIAFVKAIKAEFPEIRVAVGGHAFAEMTNYKQYIDADIFSLTADELIRKVNS